MKLKQDPTEWEKAFTKKFSDNVIPGSPANDLFIGKYDGEKIMSFIKEQIKEAEQRGRDAGLDCLYEEINEHVRKTQDYDAPSGADLLEMLESARSNNSKDV